MTADASCGVRVLMTMLEEEEEEESLILGFLGSLASVTPEPAIKTETLKSCLEILKKCYG